MHRSIFRLAPLVALSLALAGCDNNNTTPTEPSPSTATVTETFIGTLTLNGAKTHPFTVTGAGTINAKLTTLTPDSTSPIGLGLGTWNGTTCQLVLPNDLAVQGSEVIGQSSTTGNFCVRIYDALGTVAEPQAYTIEVTHQ